MNKPKHLYQVFVKNSDTGKTLICGSPSIFMPTRSHETGRYPQLTYFLKPSTQNARAYAAKTNLDCAKLALNQDFGFAEHVTLADKYTYIQKELRRAVKIVAGELDHNFTVAQRINYYLTGACVPFLSI